MFTLTDKTLLDRAARMINGQAKALRVEHEANGWASTEAGRKAKQEYDRLLRDERDMRSLGKRLYAHFDVKADRTKTPAPLLPEPPGGSFTGNVPSVSRETGAGNPELTPATVGGNVNPVIEPGGNDVGF
jgi:hypothetical protein